MKEYVSRWTILTSERTNLERAHELALKRLDSLPLAEIVKRIERAIEVGNVLEARQYARAIDRRREFLRRNLGEADE